MTLNVPASFPADDEYQVQAAEFLLSIGGIGTNYPQREQTTEEFLKDLAAGMTLAATDPTPAHDGPQQLWGIDGGPGFSHDPELQPPATQGAPPAADDSPDWITQAAAEREANTAPGQAAFQDLPSAVQPLAAAMQAHGLSPLDHWDTLQDAAAVVAQYLVGDVDSAMLSKATAVNAALKTMGLPEFFES